MTVYSSARFRARIGQEREFETLFADLPRDFAGLRRFALVKTGKRDYCTIGEWDDFDSLAAARPLMIANLDRFQHTLEDLGDGRGVTDAVSAEPPRPFQPEPARRLPMMRQPSHADRAPPAFCRFPNFRGFARAGICL